MTYILALIGNATFIITAEQKKSIEQDIQSGVKAISIGENTIFLHQVTGIYSIDTYRRISKARLDEKGMKMCKNCGTILRSSDICACKDFPHNYPPIMEMARKENPQLAKELDALAQAKSFPQLTDGN